MRIGFGYDVHALVEDRKLILGGVEIPYEKGLLGHSDADVCIHAIMDAILGALALGDIGQLFPDNDMKYKDIDSTLLLEKVAHLMMDQGYRIGNVDCTIVCQEPKLANYIVKMRKVITRCLQTNITNISIKATTTEWLGFEGKKEGIAAFSNVLLKQWDE